MPLQLGAPAAQDADDIRLQRGIERGLDAALLTPPAVCEHHLNEMRRDECRRHGLEPQPLCAGDGRLLRSDPPLAFQSVDNRTLAGKPRFPGTIRTVCRGPVRKSREKRRLSHRQHRRRNAEVDLAGTRGTNHLVSVRREAQIQGEDLALGEAMLQSQGNLGFLQLPRGAACASSRGALIEEELAHLLCDGRRALDNPAGADVSQRGPCDRNRVDAGMQMESAILRGQRGIYQRGGPMIGR